MRRTLLWMFALMMGSVCQAEDITIRYNGATAKVTQQKKDSVNVTVDGAKVNIVSLYQGHKLTLRLTGKSDDGQLVLKTAGKAKVTLDGLTLTSQEGAPLDLKNKKKVGSPEEGLDCDFAPLVVEGGTIFSVGGGMGEMPSVPSNEDAKQPTALLIGINIVKDEPVYIYDGNGKLIDTVTIPFSLRRSASLIGSPAFKVGNTYTVKTKGYEKTFTLNEPFTAVR